MSRRAAAGRAELLANGAVDMEHGLEIENVGRRGPLSTAVTWPLADGPSVCFEFWQNWANSGKLVFLPTSYTKFRQNFLFHFSHFRRPNKIWQKKIKLAKTYGNFVKFSRAGKKQGSHLANLAKN